MASNSIFDSIRIERGLMDPPVPRASVASKPAGLRSLTSSGGNERVIQYRSDDMSFNAIIARTIAANPTAGSIRVERSPNVIRREGADEVKSPGHTKVRQIEPVKEESGGFFDFIFWIFQFFSSLFKD